MICCGAIEASCVCVDFPDHEGPHRCECGGEWRIDEEGKFDCVKLPGDFGVDGPLSAMGAYFALIEGIAPFGAFGTSKLLEPIEPAAYEKKGRARRS